MSEGPFLEFSWLSLIESQRPWAKEMPFCPIPTSGLLRVQDSIRAGSMGLGTGVTRTRTVILQLLEPPPFPHTPSFLRAWNPGLGEE